jgi:hypothetical protein
VSSPTRNSSQILRARINIKMSEASATQKEREGLARKSSPDLEGGISEDEDPLDEYIARPAHRGFGRGK